MRALLLVTAGFLCASGCAQFKQMTGNITPKLDTNLGTAQRDIERAKAEADKFAKPLADAKKECANLDPENAKHVPWEEERQMGGAVAMALASQGKGYFIEISPDLPAGHLDVTKWADKKVKPPVGDKARLNEYMNQVGQYLAGFSDRPHLRWTFVVLENDAANAFSAPGGYVFITTGLLKLVDNEAQLAAVLAHEVGHVRARHSMSAYMEGKYKACFVAVLLSEVMKGAPAISMKELAAIPGVPDGAKEVLKSLTKEEIQKSANSLRASASGKKFDAAAEDGGVLMLLTDITSWIVNNTGYAKDSEFAADATAHELMALAGYDPAEFAKLLKKLPDGNYFSPHPSNKDRIAKFNEVPAPESFIELTAAAPANGEHLKLVK